MVHTTKIGHLWKDAGWRAALTILLGSRELSDDIRVWRHVDPDRREIRFTEILESGRFSTGKRHLLEVAASLFSSESKVNLRTALNGLDDRDRRLVIVAMCNFSGLRGLDLKVAKRRSRRSTTSGSRARPDRGNEQCNRTASN